MNEVNKMEKYAEVKKLQPIGGSLALLLPSYVRHMLNLSKESNVKISMEKGKMIIENFD